MNRLTAAQLNLIKMELLDAMKVVFNGTLKGNLHPEEWQIKVGISYFLNSSIGAFPGKRANELGLTTKYVIKYCTEEVKAVLLAPDYEFGLPRDLVNEKKQMQLHLSYIRRKADLVWDDKEELIACNFSGFGSDKYLAILNLSHEIRQKVFAGSLDDVKIPAGTLASSDYFSKNRERFYLVARDHATYDNESELLMYYPKWRNPRPEKRKDREMHIDNLSDEYIMKNAVVVKELLKNRVYMLINFAEARALILLDVIKGEIIYDVLFEYNLHGSNDFFPTLNRYIDEVRGKSKSEQKGEIIFFYSIEGSNSIPSNLHPPVPPRNVRMGTSLYEEILDPQQMVLEIRDESVKKPDILQQKFDEKAWLRELIRLKFSDRWVCFWNNQEGEKRLYDAPVRTRQRQLEELRIAIKGAKGPLLESLEAKLNKLESDKVGFVIPRGYLYDKARKVRVVGNAESFIYLYHPGANLLTRIPMFVFYRRYSERIVTDELYEMTKGLIPLIKITLIVSMAVIGAGVLGVEGLIGVGRYALQKYLIDQGLKKVTMEAVKEVLDRLLKRIILTIGNVIVSALPATDSKKVEFVRGLLNGYTNSTWKSLSDRIVNLAKLEPPLVKMIRLSIRIETTLRMIDTKMSELKALVDGRVGELLANRFVDSSMKIYEGLLGIVQNFLFLEYEQAQPLLELYAELAGEKPLTKDQWNKLRHKNFVVTLNNYVRAFKDVKEEIGELYSDVQKTVVILRGANHLAYLALFANSVAMPWLLPTIVAILGVIVAVTFKPSDIAEFVQGSFKNMDPQKSFKLGDLVGQILGALTINREVYGKKKKWRERWHAGESRVKIVGTSLLRSQAEVSSALPIVHLLLFNYWELAEKVLKSTKEVWNEFGKDIDNILYDKEFEDLFPEDRTLTIPKFYLILERIERALVDWLKELGKDPLLKEKIESMIHLLDSIQPGEFPSFKDLIQGKDAGKWTREVILFVIISQLQISLQNVKIGIGMMTEPVNPKDPEPLSVLGFTQLLGFTSSDSQANNVLDEGTETLISS